MSIIFDKLKLLPDNPGVYVMLNGDGQIIYVGKAKNLKNRVRSYFHSNKKPEKVEAMVKNIADFYYFVVPSEIDALSLENNLIKKHKPHYNILLKDDKTYPYIKINLKDIYPTFSVTRKILNDGAKYFGPFMGGISVNNVLDILNLAFTIRPCNKKLSNVKPIKPCLNYHIKKCLAPCCFYISEKEYRENVDKAIDFMNGDMAKTEKLLKEKMMSASDNEDFELALKYRDCLYGLDKIKLKRVTALNKFIDADVISYRSNGIYCAVSMLFVRKGIMQGGKNFSFSSAEADENVLSEFILRYYNKNSDIPNEIITESEILDGKIIEEYFKKELNKTVYIFHAKQGDKKKLADMAGDNAQEYLDTAIGKVKHKYDMTISACQRLKEILNLKRYPKRMECYDISNISGVDKVGSMVVFTDGVKDSASYRRFKIKTFEGADDFRAHQEMMRRRLDRMVSDENKFPKPDLIVIDGGKGQLSAVKEVFDEKGIKDIDLIALAERNEEIYTLFSKEPIVLKRSDYCLQMLQRIRDEAHRFAITYHRNLRSKRAISSVLDKVNGLGKVKIHAVLEHFKDIGGIIKATEEDLMQVEGIGKKQATEIIKTLVEEGLR